MTLNKNTAAYIFFVSFLLSISLSGCGGGGSNSTTQTTPSATPTNTAPIIVSPNADQSATVGLNFNYDATKGGTTVTDADGDSLTYSIVFDPSSTSLTSSDGIISGTPSQSGTINVTLTANDGKGGQVSDIFNVEVVEPVTSNQKPNIIFLITDDQGLDASAEYAVANDPPSTPNLTTLANTGLIFDNLWVSPTCSPTRAGLMTGKYSLRSQVFQPGDSLMTTETILHSFLKNGNATSVYNSALIGKWHLGNGRTGPNDFGIDYFAGITNGGVSDYWDWTLNVNGTNSNNTTYVTSALTDLAIDWVNEQTNPWFLWLAYNAPHTPFHLPPTDLHSRSLSGTDADIAANPRPYYLAAIEALDTEFGRLMNSLSAQQRDNTIIIYIGDNGTPSQVIDRSVFPTGSKDTLFQAGVSVPMFVSGAGVTRVGERESALINHTDFFPTFVELAGGDLDSYNDGKSFASLLTSDTTIPRSVAYSEDENGFAIRNTRYKLVETNSGTQDLYDLQTDPTEQDNLLDSSADTSAILAELETAASDIRQ